MTLVRDVHQNAVKQKIVGSMARLCKDMGIAVVAEGIEMPEERDSIVELGCDLLQGNLLARPRRRTLGGVFFQLVKAEHLRRRQ